MSRAHDLFRPNCLKLLLAATLIIPVFFILVLVTGFPYNDMLFPAAITIVIGYATVCIIDDVVQSRTIKIAIASAAALVSIIIGSLLLRSMTVICDPVHDPRMVCDLVHIPEPTEPTVLATVHEPGSCSGDVCSIAPGIVTGIVAEKLDEHRRKNAR